MKYHLVMIVTMSRNRVRKHILGTFDTIVEIQAYMFDNCLEATKTWCVETTYEYHRVSDIIVSDIVL